MRLTLFLLALLGIAAALPEGEPARLLQDGRRAYEQGDFTAALNLFDQAEVLADDPGQVAFAQATAHFRLAIEGGEEAARHLAEAILLFRCNLDVGNPRRGESLVGVGSCLLFRAGRTREHGAAEEALQVLEQTRNLDLKPSLAVEARRLLHRARLMEWQLLPQPREDTPPEPPPGEPEKQPGMKEQNPEKGPPEKQPGNSTEKNMGTKPTPVEDPNGEAKEKEGGPKGTQAAEGTQPAVSDRDPLPPELSSEEAIRRLREATRRIQAEHKAFRQSLSRPPVEGVPDW